MSKLFFSTIFLAVAILFIQCKKEGVTGPEGPRGETGATGNANVKVDTFRLTNAQWQAGGTYILDHVVNGYMWSVTRFHERAFPSITQDILNTGMVLCYFTPSIAFNANNWVPLNYSMLSPNDNYFYNVAYETTAGKVKLHYYYRTNDDGVAAPSIAAAVIPVYRFKIVAVSGSIASGRMMPGATATKLFYLKGKDYTEADLKAMPYSEVCSLLDIAP